MDNKCYNHTTKSYILLLLILVVQINQHFDSATW